MIEVAGARRVPRCAATTLATVDGVSFIVQCDEIDEHFGSHSAWMSEAEVWVWPSEDDVEEALLSAKIDAMTDEEVMRDLTDGDPAKEAEIKQWAQGTAAFVKSAMAMRAEITTLKAQVDAITKERDQLAQIIFNLRPHP